MARLGLLALALVACLSAARPAAAERVDLALVLAVDVSGSVNPERYDLQRQGYAKAFASREVLDAIAGGRHQAILVTLVEWSGADHQQQTVGWSLIRDPASAAAFGSALAEAPRAFADWTSISGAIDFAVTLLKRDGIDAERLVIDISGDGINNHGRPVEAAREDALEAGVTINGLPILSEYPTLDAYYRDSVIGGPGAFAAVAKDFSDFSTAILGKLVREIADRHQWLQNQRASFDSRLRSIASRSNPEGPTAERSAGSARMRKVAVGHPPEDAILDLPHPELVEGRRADLQR